MGFAVQAGSESTGSGPRPNLKPIVPHIIVLAVGTFITMGVNGGYDLLDEWYVRGAYLLIYLLAGVLITLSFAPKVGALGKKWLQRIAFVLALSQAALGILLLMNCGLDRFPTNDVTATVLEKKVINRRRGGDQYHIYVSSWRPGVSREDLRVGSLVFERAAVGKIVTVELHPGYLGQPWYADVSPEGE